MPLATPQRMQNLLCLSLVFDVDRLPRFPFIILLEKRNANLILRQILQVKKL